MTIKTTIDNRGYWMANGGPEEERGAPEGPGSRSVPVRVVVALVLFVLVMLIAWAGLFPFLRGLLPLVAWGLILDIIGVGARGEATRLDTALGGFRAPTRRRAHHGPAVSDG